MNGLTVQSRDAAVAEDEFLAIGELLLRDAVDCMNLVDGAVRRRQLELRVGEDWIGRVVGFAGLEIEEAIAGFGQFGTVR